MARCTEIEMSYPEPRHWGLKPLMSAQDRCLRLGYSRDALAECTQRQLRTDAAPPQH